MVLEQVKQGINAVIDNLFVPPGAEVSEITISVKLSSSMATIKARREKNGVWDFSKKDEEV